MVMVMVMVLVRNGESACPHRGRRYADAYLGEGGPVLRHEVRHARVDLQPPLHHGVLECRCGPLRTRGEEK